MEEAMFVLLGWLAVMSPKMFELFFEAISFILDVKFNLSWFEKTVILCSFMSNLLSIYQNEVFEDCFFWMSSVW